jgi:D-serine deaminase-like pyridoxal phosphate-dependent protein
MALAYEAIRDALSGERLPAAFVDLDALDRNLDRHVAMVRPRGTPLRIATKSIRVVAILRRLLERGGDALRGLMCFSVEEAEWLAEQGFDDLLVAYPPWQASDMERVARLAAAGKTVRIVLDAREAIDRADAFGRAAGVRVPIVLCLDMGLVALGGRVFLGVRRSPLRTPDEVLALARHALDRPGVRFDGLMGYEAQVAGLGDASPFEPRTNAIKRAIRAVSAREVATRRRAIVERLRAAGVPLALVNGGGTGSLDTTTPESGVTEVTAGSGFFKSHLFDYYRAPHMRALEPACFFALEVTRAPAADVVTCLGGGYVASGAVGPDKAPLPWLPRGLSLLPMEMAGEVQTPVRVPADVRLSFGDPVIFRHAKAGELAERFREYLLVAGGRVVDRVPTYRGAGRCFF